MITERVTELVKTIKNGSYWEIGTVEDVSRLIATELIENCLPTKEEAAQCLRHMSLEPDVWWDFILWIPRWDKANRTTDHE